MSTLTVWPWAVSLLTSLVPTRPVAPASGRYPSHSQRYISASGNIDTHMLVCLQMSAKSF